MQNSLSHIYCKHEDSSATMNVLLREMMYNFQEEELDCANVQSYFCGILENRHPLGKHLLYK